MRLRGVAAIACIGILPLLVAKYLPIQDFPNVLAIVATLGRQHTPDFERHFRVDWSFGPYTAFYAVTYGLSKLVGANAAVRLMVGFPMMGIPVAVAHLGRRLRVGGEAAGVLIIPLLFTELYFVGFHPFLWSLFFSVLAASALDRFLREGESAHLIGSGFGLVLSWLAHPSAPLIFFATAGVVLASASAERARVARALLVLGPLMIGALVYVVTAQPVDVREATTIRIPLSNELRYDAMLPAFAVVSARFVPEWLGYVVAAAYGALVFARAVTGTRGTRHRLLAWAVPAELFAVSVILPFGAGPVVWMDTRVVLCAWVSVLLLGGSGARPRAELAAMFGVVGVVLACVLYEHVSFERETRPLDRLFSRIPSGSTLVGLTFSRTSEDFVPICLREAQVRMFSLDAHFVSWFHSEHGGVSPMMTFHPSLTWIPLRLRDESFARRFPITTPFLPNRTLRSVVADPTGIDFVIARRIRSEHRASLGSVADEVARAGRFDLYRIRRARSSD